MKLKALKTGTLRHAARSAALPELDPWSDPKESSWSAQAFPLQWASLALLTLGIIAIVVFLGRHIDPSPRVSHRSDKLQMTSGVDGARSSLIGRPVSESDSIESLVGKAFAFRMGQNHYLAQSVRLTSGFTRTAYFRAHSANGFQLDEQSLHATSSHLWNSLCSTEQRADANWLCSILVGFSGRSSLDIGHCRVFARPHDFYPTDLSPETHLCLRIEDLDRQYSTTAYAPRDSLAGMELLRVFGPTHFAPRDGLPSRNDWKEKPVTLHLEAVPSAGPVSPLFVVEELVSETWLVSR